MEKRDVVGGKVHVVLLVGDCNQVKLPGLFQRLYCRVGSFQKPIGIWVLLMCKDSTEYAGLIRFFRDLIFVLVN